MMRNFSAVPAEQTLQRAIDMAPVLLERAARAEAERVLLPETVRDLLDAGILRALQPRRWGGMEYDYLSYIDIPMALARGCASTSWCVVNLMIHNWMLAQYDDRAQAEVWEGNPDALIAAGIAFPQGQAVRVAGGYVINGRWNFSSAVHVAEWCMLAVTLRDESGKPVEYRMCLLDKSQYEVIDDWRVLGMRSTGSMTVAAKDVFVPDYKVLDMGAAARGDFPGAKVNPNPLYLVSLAAMGGHGLAATAVGNAMAALDYTRDMVKARSTNYTGARMRDFQTVQLRVGQAGARIDAARHMLRQDCVEVMDIVRSGGLPDTETKLRYKRDAAFAAQLATEAVDALHTVTGATGIYESYPLERMFRDAHALAAHISLNADAQSAAWGLVAMGGEVVVPTL